MKYLEKMHALVISDSIQNLATLILLIAAIQSCTNGSRPIDNMKTLLKQCDEVVVVLDNRNNSSNSSFKISDTSGINVFTELVTGNNENINDSCDPIGDILYKKEGKILFIAEFSVPIPQLNNNCLYVRYNLQQDTFRHRLTYRAGMALGNIEYRGEAPTGASTNDANLIQ